MSLSIYEIEISELPASERAAIIKRINQQTVTGAYHYPDNVFHIQFELESSEYLIPLKLPDNCHLKLIHQGDK